MKNLITTLALAGGLTFGSLKNYGQEKDSINTKTTFQSEQVYDFVNFIKENGEKVTSTNGERYYHYSKKIGKYQERPVFYRAFYQEGNLSLNKVFTEIIEINRENFEDYQANGLSTKEDSCIYEYSGYLGLSDLKKTEEKDKKIIIKSFKDLSQDEQFKKSQNYLKSLTTIMHEENWDGY